MTWRRPVGSICQHYKYGISGTKGPEFIRCVFGQDTQMHEVYCFGSDGITREFHPTARVDVDAGFVGQFSSHYLTKNWRRIPVLGQISINGSVVYLCIPDFHRTSGPMWYDNLLDPRASCGYGGTSNQNWGVQSRGYYSNVAMAWSTTVPSCPYYMTWSLEIPRVAAHCVRDDFCRARRCKLDRICSISCNPFVDVGVNWRGDYWEGPDD